MTIRHGLWAKSRPGGGLAEAGGCACPDPVSSCNWGWVSYGRLSATGPGQPEAPAHPHQLEPATFVPKEALGRISMEASMRSVMKKEVHSPCPNMGDGRYMYLGSSGLISQY